MPQASPPTTHVTRHRATVDAPGAVVFDLLADVSLWPHLFTPTVHAQRIAGDDSHERIRLWALANGEVRSWISRRDLDRRALRITFRQDVSQHPVAAMGGTWQISEGPDDSCTVELLHDFAAVDDDPRGVEWIERAVERNSTAELAALKAGAETRVRCPELVMSFEDAVTIDGSAQAAHDFIRRCDLWPERLPHVARLDLVEEEPGIQLMSMDTRAPDGTVHTTESVRVVLEDGRIVYKQTRVPALMTAHTGQWQLTAGVDGVRAASRHTVVLNPGTLADHVGLPTVDAARAAVRAALGGNSLATLRLAKSHAEGGTRE
ncbi:aromatase/cyclase [Streptomyces tremellae]|uniref:SRPBCC family protein n=1 Tax=Streptomyces tremellae TaxID=1124239 RepID=A0ABP7EW22_9ACTN